MSDRKAFLVSGGSGGIGSAVCQALASQGFLPVVGYHRNPEAAAVVAERSGGRCLYLDLTAQASIQHAAEQLAAQPEPLAGVILAASPPLSLTPFGKTTAEEMEAQWRVNVLGPQQLLAELVRRCLRQQRQGSVVGVLSAAMGGEDGWPATPRMAAYVTAKHGLAGVLAALAAEYPWLQVRTVRPGFTETAMLSAFDDRFLEIQRSRQPFHSPAAVAEMIVQAALPAGLSRNQRGGKGIAGFDERT